MTTNDVELLSQEICRRLIESVDWAGINSLHSYIPLPHLHEVDIWPVLKFVWQDYPQIMTAVAPGRPAGPSRIINPAIRWRGLAPHAAAPVPDSQQFDLILVPVLGFDQNLQRLGWGGGWYDRFLAGQTKALKIGLCFSFGLVKEGLPAELHDISMDKIITEQAIIVH